MIFRNGIGIPFSFSQEKLTSMGFSQPHKYIHSQIDLNKFTIFALNMKNKSEMKKITSFPCSRLDLVQRKKEKKN
jgi:hypothetical protein